MANRRCLCVMFLVLARAWLEGSRCEVRVSNCPSTEVEHKGRVGFVWLSVAHCRGKGPLLDDAQCLGVQVRTFRSLYHRVVRSCIFGGSPRWVVWPECPARDRQALSLPV